MGIKRHQTLVKVALRRWEGFTLNDEPDFKPAIMDKKKIKKINNSLVHFDTKWRE